MLMSDHPVVNFVATKSVVNHKSLFLSILSDLNTSLPVLKLHCAFPLSFG